jgi:hypothetical protein
LRSKHDLAKRDAEREQAASAIAAWLIKHAVEATDQHPTGTNFVPVAIEPEEHIIWAIVEQPTASGFWPKLLTQT